MDIDLLRGFFGWMSALNLCLLMFSTIMMMVFKDWVMSVHRKFFDLSDEQFNLTYFKFIAAYKLLTLIFCVTPYVALILIDG